ncbi:MAG TPA: dihydrodipicolinate reductase C-terminal domain-containing protein [Vicinamibacterales bacterium]
MKRLLIIGHGRMGQLVETLAPEYGFEVAGVVTGKTPASQDWPVADVAIDFSVAHAVPSAVARMVTRGTPIVIGTTGWQAEEEAVRRSAESLIGVVAAPNFAVGVNVFLALVERLGSLMAAQPSFGAWIHELHHAAKKDAPSGTALAIERRLREHGYTRDVPISSTRAGAIPGTHTLGFDSASETITLTHQARDRAAFARGALVAARWIDGKRGWFSMRDVLGGMQ